MDGFEDRFDNVFAGLITIGVGQQLDEISSFAFAKRNGISVGVSENDPLSRFGLPLAQRALGSVLDEVALIIKIGGLPVSLDRVRDNGEIVGEVGKVGGIHGLGSSSRLSCLRCVETTKKDFVVKQFLYLLPILFLLSLIFNGLRRKLFLL